MPSPRVIAIVLNFNGGPAVLETLQALLAGSTVPRVIVVDNASSDGSSDRIRECFPEIEILFKAKNIGFAGGMNAGMRAALRTSCEFIWLVNDDCQVAGEALAALLAFADSHQRVGLMSPLIAAPGGEPWFAGGSIQWGRMRAVHCSGRAEYLSGCALFLRRAVAEKTLLDERYFLYYEDVAFSLAARKAGFELAVVPTARAVHAARRMGSPEATYWLVRSGLEFFLREAGPMWQIWYRVFVPLRRMKNAFQRLRHPQDPIASAVSRAYTDALP